MEPKVAAATPDENPYAEAMTPSSAPAPKAGGPSGSRRMQDDPQFARLNDELLELDQAEKDYRKASRLELKSACAKRQWRRRASCSSAGTTTRTPALEKNYRSNAG